MVVANDLYAVKTRSQAQAAHREDAVKKVSKPYSAQIQDAITNRRSSCANDTPSLKSIQVAFPLDELKASYPDVCESLLRIVDSDEENGVHTLKGLKDSYIDCTYIDILVNKHRVCAIVDSGAPFNIVSTKLVKKLGIAPDVDYRVPFGTAGKDQCIPLERIAHCPCGLVQ